MPPSPSVRDDTRSSEAESSPYHNAGLVDEMGLPYEPADLRALISTPPAGHWSPTGMMGANPEWWAAMLSAGGVPANGAQGVLSTPPTSHMTNYQLVEQPTPEKYRELVPPFPGIRQKGSDIAEPMKISLPASRHFPTFPVQETPEPHRQDAPQTLNSMMNYQAQCAWAAQAKMDYDLVAAQLKVQELQVKRQLYNVAQFAATTNATGLSPANPVVESHFDNIMQALHQLPAHPISPADVVPPQTIRPATLLGLDPAVDNARAVSCGGSPMVSSPQEGSRATQSWHPADISEQRGTAFVI